MTKTETPATKCLRCGRTLTSAASVARGYGRHCGTKVRAAADVIDLTAFKDAKAARDKALDILEQGGLIPTSREGLFQAVSSDGTTRYLVDIIERSCECRAGIRLGRCSHLVAADIVVAA